MNQDFNNQGFNGQNSEFNNPQVGNIQQPMQPQNTYQQPVQPQTGYQPNYQPQYTPPKKNGALIVIIVLIVAIVMGGAVFGLYKLFSGFMSGVKDKVTENLHETYKGNGFTFEYDYNWVNGSLNAKKAIKREKDNTIFVPIGTSTFDEDYSCDFDTTSCREKVYNDFYGYWSDELESASLVLVKADTFEKLINDLYIASYDYGKSSSKITGRYYLVVSGEKNVILSFMFSSDSSVSSVDKDIKKMLETLSVEKKELTNKAKEKELAEGLNALSNWNMYSSKRTGAMISRSKTLNGGWRILSEGNTYWIFRNGEFYWYKDYGILTDNYLYGTYIVTTGREGLKTVGIDENKLDQIISQSNNTISTNDVYSLVLTPTKIISNGQDLSSTNIPAGSTWKQVWILVDHGNDGIEAQELDVDSNSASYYFKVVS